MIKKNLTRVPTNQLSQIKIILYLLSILIVTLIAKRIQAHDWWKKRKFVSYAYLKTPSVTFLLGTSISKYYSRNCFMSIFRRCRLYNYNISVARRATISLIISIILSHLYFVWHFLFQLYECYNSHNFNKTYLI